MTVGKISATCWTIFIVMSVLFGPVLLVTIALHSAILIVAFIVLWWTAFVYAMYLAMAVTRKGDRRLLKRGIQGTAAVLSARATNEVIQSGEFAWEAPRVYKYELLVDLPGKKPYKTTCRICASGIRQGQTVNVAASKHNRKRVTIDIGQGQPSGAPRQAPGAAYSPVGSGSDGPGRVPANYVSASHVSSYAASGVGRDTPSTDSERFSALEQLGSLHKQGVLTDTEFAEQKARILAE
jgi:Short C-terminal domain